MSGLKALLRVCAICGSVVSVICDTPIGLWHTQGSVEQLLQQGRVRVIILPPLFQPTDHGCMTYQAKENTILTEPYTETAQKYPFIGIVEIVNGSECAPCAKTITHNCSAKLCGQLTTHHP